MRANENRERTPGVILIDKLIVSTEKVGEAKINLNELFNNVNCYSKINLDDAQNKDCGVSYSIGSTEYFFWALGLMSLEWILFLLRQKSDEGLCRNPNHFKPCKISSEFHKKLYDKCKDMIEGLL